MTSELRVTTLLNATGDGPAALTKQNAAKYFIYFDDSQVISQSLNSSSITDQGVGAFDLAFTNNMSAVKYSISGYSNCYGGASNFSGDQAIGLGTDYGSSTKQTPTGGFGFQSYHTALIDGGVNAVQTFGDLA